MSRVPCKIAWRPAWPTVCFLQSIAVHLQVTCISVCIPANGRKHAIGTHPYYFVAGLVIFGVVILPVAFWFISRRKPIEVARGFSKALVLAFGTSSSSAALPVSVLPLHSPFASHNSHIGRIPGHLLRLAHNGRSHSGFTSCNTGATHLHALRQR